MSIDYLVETGLFGQISRLRSPDSRRYQADDPVVCRTERGLEAGRIVCCLDEEPWHEPAAGDIMRRMTPEDRMIAERLVRYRDRAFDACTRLLNERQIPAVLVDVEHLLDGQSIFFYFLGEVTPELDALTAELCAAYDAKVRFRQFAERMANGCGPECGTGASGCGTGGCGSCALSGRCGTAAN